MQPLNNFPPHFLLAENDAHVAFVNFPVAVKHAVKVMLADPGGAMRRTIRAEDVPADVQLHDRMGNAKAAKYVSADVFGCMFLRAL